MPGARLLRRGAAPSRAQRRCRTGYAAAWRQMVSAGRPAPPRLLPMWDSTMLAHAVPGRLLPREYRPSVVRRNGDILPCLLVDGQVAGVWRATDGGLALTAFRTLAKAAWHGLTEEAKRLCVLLGDRDPAVYRRTGHWWDKGIPGVESRIVKG
ncbi:crosslink repair DNA glycosylase YcaQ family protein [Streptomyces sp. GD-15H]|uniref:DNA glycosylase AlkZ-like family protein n=1 Tax=Streptomyces sp. GD-15H TaxID=3129112 RepID=UPI0032490A57